MKTYTLKFSVTLIEGLDEIYNPKRVMNFDVKEQLPANVEAQKYIRQRLAEEVKRNFGQSIEKIENFTEEAEKAIDPLEEPF